MEDVWSVRMYLVTMVTTQLSLLAASLFTTLHLLPSDGKILNSTSPPQRRLQLTRVSIYSSSFTWFPVIPAMPTYYVIASLSLGDSEGHSKVLDERDDSFLSSIFQLHSRPSVNHYGRGLRRKRINFSLHQYIPVASIPYILH